MTGREVVVTGAGVELPRTSGLPDALLAALGTADLPVHASVRDGAFAPDLVLGPRGFKFKDRATRLSLCAASHALVDAGLPAGKVDGDRDPFSVGVVGSSNLGNVDTVCRVVQEIGEQGSHVTSPLDLPNASGNVPAAAVASWFGMRAVNLMVCSGVTSGLDALRLAVTAVRGGRADIVLVVGVESASEPARLLLERASGDPAASVLVDGAAAVVVESGRSARERGARIRARIGGHGAGGLAPSITAALPDGRMDAADTLWFAPPSTAPGAAEVVALREGPLADVPVADVSAGVGEWYGALGVAQCALAACALHAGRARTAVLSCGPGWGDGAASTVLHAVPTGVPTGAVA